MERNTRERLHELGLPQLFMRLPGEAGLLVRAQVRLARAEMKTKAAAAARYFVLLAAGLLILAVSLLAAVACAIIVIASFIPLWISAVAVTLALFIAGGILALAGLSRLKKMEWRPEKTVETLKENIQWLRGQAK